MADSNLTDKLSETITNVFKKTKVFEKMSKIQFLLGTFVILSSIFGITEIYMHYSNSNKIDEISENQENIYNIIEINSSVIKNRINQLEFKLSILLENQKNMINDIKNLPIYKIQKIHGINVSTSTSAFSPIKHIDNINDSYNKDDNINITSIDDLNTEQKKIKEIEDNELIDECYDSIPLNNIKTTGLSWLFR